MGLSNFYFKVDRSGEQCQVVPRREPKSTEWMDEIYARCVDSINSGTVPDPQYPIDEMLEMLKEEERMQKFDKVTLNQLILLIRGRKVSDKESLDELTHFKS